MFLRAEPSLGVDAAHAHVSAASGTVDGALGRRASSRVCDGGVGEFPGAKRGRVGVRGDSAGEPARHLRRRVRDVSRAQRLRRAHRSRRGAFRRRSRRTPRVRPRSSRARFAAAFPELRFRAFRLAGSISRVVHLDEDASQLEEWEAMGVLDGPYPGAIPAFGQLLTGCMVSVRGAVDADPSAPPLSLRKCAAVELLRPTVWRVPEVRHRDVREARRATRGGGGSCRGAEDERRRAAFARAIHGGGGIAPNVRGSTTRRRAPRRNHPDDWPTRRRREKRRG